MLPNSVPELRGRQIACDLGLSVTIRRDPGCRNARPLRNCAEQIQLTERLAFDEAWFAEHHHSDYGMLASPGLIVANLAPRTSAAQVR